MNNEVRQLRLRIAVMVERILGLVSQRLAIFNANWTCLRM